MARKRLNSSGFTLLELIVTMAIIAILASVAMPKYADLLLKSEEGATKGNLGSLRSALEIYYADNNGTSPTCVTGAASTVFTDNLIPKYMPLIPLVKNGLHPPTSDVYCDAAMVAGDVHDGQGWYYDGTYPGDSLAGSVWVACDHTDSVGNSWSSY